MYLRGSNRSQIFYRYKAIKKNMKEINKVRYSWGKCDSHRIPKITANKRKPSLGKMVNI